MENGSTKVFKKSNEQINNKTSDFDPIASDFFRKVRSILEKDEFNLLQTKSKRKIVKAIKQTGFDIDRLIKLNVDAKTTVKTISEKTSKLKTENSKKMRLLRERLI